MNPLISPRYMYQPLESDDGIRLAVLHPGRRGDCVRLSLVKTKLSEAPMYEALSYVWGSDERPFQGYIDGVMTTLRQNLWSALIHLRSKSRDRVLWIDAVCIDQNNIEERNRQIRLMGNIYSKADAVLIWLGNSSDTSDTAMEWIRDCSSRSSNSLGLRHHSLGRLSILQICQQQADKWRALEELCFRDYWRRVWIVQEVVLARRVIIRCGDAEAKWDGFSSLMDDYDALFKPKSCLALIKRIRGSLPAQLQELRKMHWYNCSGCSILDLMRMTSDSLSTDPRDKVYGLLGLASDGHEIRMTIDYSKTILEMYQSLWHSYVSANSPIGYDLVSDFFHCILKNTPFEPSAALDKTGPDLYVLGQSVGKIVYTGQPWRGRYDIDIYSDNREWISIMERLRSEGLRVEQELRIFKAAFSRAGLILADPFSSSTQSMEFSIGSFTTPNFKKFAHKSLDELDANVVIHRELLSQQTLVILSGGQIAITMSSTRVGDEVYQFQDREVTVVCCNRSGEMKCSALLPRRQDGNRVRDAPMDRTMAMFDVASGVPTLSKPRPRDLITQTTEPNCRVLSEMPSNSRYIDRTEPRKLPE